MGLTRIYHAELSDGDNEIVLSLDQSHHLLHVMRLKISEQCVVFNGTGLQAYAVLFDTNKKQAVLRISNWFETQVESPLHIHLLQAISKSSRMDFAVQKAVELGVMSITPVITSRSIFRKSPQQEQKKMKHWQQIAIHAAEQSGRVIVPKITDVYAWNEAVKYFDADSKYICHTSHGNSNEKYDKPNSVLIAIGPEGGFSDQEINDAQEQGFGFLHMGPRILRTETASVVALALIQNKWGDFSC